MYRSTFSNASPTALASIAETQDSKNKYNKTIYNNMIYNILYTYIFICYIYRLFYVPAYYKLPLTIYYFLMY